MKFILISALIVCSVLAAPQVSETQVQQVRGINDQLKKALENLKQQLPCGFPDFGVPPLAPYKKPYAEVQYEHLLFSILGVFIDSKLAGLDNYVVNDVQFSVFTMKAQFDINFNKIHLTGDYVLNLFLVNILKITGKGDLDLMLQDFRIKGNAQIGANDNGLYLKDFHVVLTLGNLKSNISGLLGGGLPGKLANRAIEDFTLFFIKNQQEFISDAIHDKIVPEVNSFFHGKSIGDLMEIINNASKPVDCIPPKDDSVVLTKLWDF